MKKILQAQKNEITEHLVYTLLSKRVKDKNNSKVLSNIAKDELKHYKLLKKITKIDAKPNKFKIFYYSLMARIFGLSFTLRLMEKGENAAIRNYRGINAKLLKEIIHDEEKHEHALIDLLAEKRIEYASSIVLGLNDALVELTGALAGLTFALRNGKLVALIGFITGFAAALSMASSEYLSTKEDTERTTKSPILGAFYTGMTYLVTVLFLIAPFVFLSNIFLALGITLGISVLIIAFYTFYITTAKNKPFWRQFTEMVMISLGVAAISFLIGLLLRIYVGIEV